MVETCVPETRLWGDVMRSAAVLFLLLLSAGCAAQPGRVANTSSTTTSAQVSSTDDPTQEETSSDEALSNYLVEMSNLDADLQIRLGSFEQSYNESFWGVGFDDFEEPAEGEEPPPPPSDDEMLEYLSGYWQGHFEEVRSHVDRLNQVAPPPGFEELHQDFAAAYGQFAEWMAGRFAGFTTLAEYNELLEPLFSGTSEGVPGELQALYAEMIESCRAIEDTAREEGFAAEIGCPNPPAEPISVTLTIGPSWAAEPDPLPVGDGLVEITIVNAGQEPVIPIVLDVWEGNPSNLPLVDGMVDLSRSGMYEGASDNAVFQVVFAAEVEIIESGLTDTPPALPPGETIVVDVWASGALVVFDYTKGAFESGAYVVVERSS